MSDDTTPQQPIEHIEPTEHTEHTEHVEEVKEKRRVRDRVFGFRSMLAVGLAGAILGGAVGTTVTLVAGHDHHDRPDRPGLVGFPGGPRGDEHGQPGGPMGGFPAPPPATEPEDGTTEGSSS